MGDGRVSVTCPYLWWCLYRPNGVENVTRVCCAASQSWFCPHETHLARGFFPIQILFFLVPTGRKWHLSTIARRWDSFTQRYIASSDLQNTAQTYDYQRSIVRRRVAPRCTLKVMLMLRSSIIAYQQIRVKALKLVSQQHTHET
ncbi:unnamed protein product [Ectocarpus sp. 12 AP-2014]